VLAKNSNTDMDFIWSADAAGMANPMTTTGDTIYSSSGSTPARLGIGTAGQVLQVNSGATAPEWATISSSATYSGVSLFSTVGVSCGNAAVVAQTWNSERFDTDSYHSTSTNTSRITIPSGKAGKYLFILRLNAGDNSATGSRRLELYKNGSPLNLIAFSPGSTIYPTLGGSMMVDAAENDYYEVFYSQNSGTTQTTDLATTQAEFSASFIGA
jgi:hypothetical protein